MRPPVLLLIDLQKGFDEIAARIRRNNLEAETRVLSLITLWREKHWPIIHVRHDSVHATSPFRPNHEPRRRRCRHVRATFGNPGDRAG